MSEMNGGSGPVPPIMISNPLIELLERVMAEVKAGRVTSLAVVMVAPNGAMPAFAGNQMGDMYVGAALLQNGLLATMTNPQQQGGRILRPGMRPGP